MSTVSTKNLLLSQPKAGQVNESISSRILTHTANHGETETVVKIEVPGVNPATIEVNCDNNAIHVMCERGEVTLPLDPTIDVSKIKADVNWGLLTIQIPLPAPPATRTIKVNIADAVVKKPAPKFTEED